jgi:hypothetical protein
MEIVKYLLDTIEISKRNRIDKGVRCNYSRLIRCTTTDIFEFPTELSLITLIIVKIKVIGSNRGRSLFYQRLKRYA